MRFFTGKHYRDTGFRDGEDIYVASGDNEEGNLVNIRTGTVFFNEDRPLYPYDVDGEPHFCFDATPMIGSPHRFIECAIIVDYADDVTDGG